MPLNRCSNPSGSRVPYACASRWVAVAAACAALVASARAQDAVSTATAALPPPVADSGSETNVYTLRFGDRLQYRLAEDPERGPAPIPIEVNSLGEASFPVSRNFDLRVTFEVRGRTVDEVREILREKLLAEYYHKATVELTLADMTRLLARVQFFGTGNVRGEVPIPPDGPPLKLSDALLRLNPPDYANLRKVRIHRPDPETGKVKVIEVDANAIIKNGQRDKDVVLLDGDRVEVPDKWLY